MKLFLDDFFRTAWANRDPFCEVAKLSGITYRAVKSRRTLRFELAGRGFFLKHHRGVGWREIFKDLFQFKRPVLGADNEFAAIEKLHRLGVGTMTAAAFGARNLNPARRESFIITAELADMPSLEELTADWVRHPPDFTVKTALINELARISALMLGNGINHRDCYLCHFLLAPDGRLHVIDLHRAQIRRRTPHRYIVKDLAGLYFSAMDAGLSRRDCCRFIRRWHGADSFRAAWCENAPLWREVAVTARRLYTKVHQRPAPEF